MVGGGGLGGAIQPEVPTSTAPMLPLWDLALIPAMEEAPRAPKAPRPAAAPPLDETGQGLRE